MKLTGYSSSVFVRPGESLGFHVHSESPNVDVQLVRLLHGDENPRGPGFQEREISSSIDGRHAAGPQEIFRGSFAELETPLRLIERDDFEIDLWIWPTRPSIGRQGIISWRAPECPEGLCLALDETGRVIAQSGTREVVRARQPLAGRAWVRIRLQGRGGRIRALHHPSRLFPALRCGGRLRRIARRGSPFRATFDDCRHFGRTRSEAGVGLSRFSTARFRGSRFVPPARRDARSTLRSSRAGAA